MEPKQIISKGQVPGWIPYSLSSLIKHGPVIKTDPSKQNATKEKPKGRVISKALIEAYKSYSIDNRIWSSLVSSYTKQDTRHPSRNLREMRKQGLLKEVGRLKGAKTNFPPYVYEWVKNAS